MKGSCGAVYRTDKRRRRKGVRECVCVREHQEPQLRMGGKGEDKLSWVWVGPRGGRRATQRPFLFVNCVCSHVIPNSPWAQRGCLFTSI